MSGQEQQEHPRGLGGEVGTPRAIAALRTDGGTAFVLRCDRSTWRPEFRRMIDRLQQPRSQDAEARERREGILLELPLPRNPGCLPLEGGAELDPRLLGWGYSDDPPRCAVQVKGNHRDHFVFHAADRAYCQLYERVDEEGVCSWEVRVEVKAREVYADGLRRWMTRWLGLWGWLLTGKWTMPDGAQESGWVTTQWHLNSDFVSFDLLRDDQYNFTSARKGSTHGRLDGRSDPNDPYLTEYRLVGPWLQTIVLGRKSSDVQLVCYRKGDQLREAKRVNPACSMYAPLWRVNGWDPEEDGDPLRIEFRFRKKGLQYVDALNRNIVYDFRNPALLLDEHAVASLWAYVTSKRRLVVPDSERKRRCSTDPRWLVVQAAAGVRAPDVRQLPRQVRELTRDERLAKDLRQAVSAAIAYAARHGVAAFSPEAIGDVLIAMGQAVKRGDIEFIERVIDCRLDLRAAVERARASTDFFAHEADAAYDQLSAAMGYDPPKLYRCPGIEEIPIH